MTADRQIQHDVLAALDFDPIDTAAIGVSVTHGIVTLRGAVPTLAQRYAAERLALAVPGVRAVANDLDVPGADEVAPDDPVIAEAAANALRWYRAVPRDAVRVTVRDGWVTLDGTVSELAERGAAERALRRLRGLRGISNAITVSTLPESSRSCQS
jgi:osmotically-inducible protein OsmY